MFFVFSLMLSFALTASVKALFERADLDLILSSPVSSKTIFSVRLTGIFISVIVLFLGLLSPFANVSIFVGQARLLGIYPALISLAMIASAFGILLTLALVKSFGVRRTRTIAQILSAIVGAIMFIASQLFGHIKETAQTGFMLKIKAWVQLGGPLDENSWIWTPGRAF